MLAIPSRRAAVQSLPTYRVHAALRRHEYRILTTDVSAAASLAEYVADVLAVTGCSPEQAVAALWVALNEAEAKVRDQSEDVPA